LPDRVNASDLATCFQGKRQSSALITTVLHGLQFGGNHPQIALNAAFLAAQWVTCNHAIGFGRCAQRVCANSTVHRRSRFSLAGDCTSNKHSRPSIPRRSRGIRRDRWCRSLDYYFRRKCSHLPGVKRGA